MGDKKKARKEKGSKESGSKAKKTKPALDGQKPKKSAKSISSKKKAWGKGRDNNIRGDEDDDRDSKRGLKTVRIKLDHAGRDAMLDILHKLHVAEEGAEGARDYNGSSDNKSDADDSGEDSDDHESGDERARESEGGDDDDSNDDSDGTDAFDGDSHGDFEYDGTFGRMANLMSELVVNETIMTKDDSESASSVSGVAAAAAAARRGADPAVSKTSNSAGVTTRDADNGLREQRKTGSKLTREELLASMVREDRRDSRDQQHESKPVSAASLVGASAVPQGPTSAAINNYRRPDPPTPGKGSDKVRLAVCGENKKTGAPDLNAKKTLVFDRKEPLQKMLDRCRAKLHIKKKAKGAALLDGDENLLLMPGPNRIAHAKVVDWLSDLSWVPNGSVVFISYMGGLGSQLGNITHRVPEPAPASRLAPGDANGPADMDGKSTEGEGVVRDDSGQGRSDDEQEAEAALALAALGRIRDTYKERAVERNMGTTRRGAAMSEDDASKHLIDKRRAVEGTAALRQMMAQRQKLPAFSQRHDIVQTIGDHQVVVLSGETGCGKTTQVPQFVLDSMTEQGKGGQCSIICTQPRRISAVGVAERVAAERCERVGDTVGYQIRLDARIGPSTRLTFCTTGILLRRLTTDSTLAGVSHIMVDEVHERDLQTDFLLVILRDLLPKRPDLRVILMSATLQADLFTRYFNDCPAIKIPGRTFPVEVSYADSITRLLRNSRAPVLMPRVFPADGRGPRLGGGAAGRGRGAETVATKRKPESSLTQESGNGREAMAYDPLTGEPLDKDETPASTVMVSPKCEDKVDYDMMIDLVGYIMKTEAGSAGGEGGRNSSGGSVQGGRGMGVENRRSGRVSSRDRDLDGHGEPLGAILVFLPGFAEIEQLAKALERHPRIGRAARIFPLHSSLPSHQQKAIFKRMPPGVRKIVISTNIAETSVTIDDCTHVIDAGRVREMRYDPITRMSCLVEVWISKASASQRGGRAGRVRPGKCWRLYPEAFYDEYMPPHTLAEMLRTPLEELVLQVLLLELGSPADFLGRAVEPPPPKMLRAALRNLDDLQAIVVARNMPILTPLGYHLAQLPMDARVGKLLLIAAILQCLDPILTIAAALSDKAPFQRPFGEQARADAARARFAQHKSDHLAIVEAFGAWRNKRRTASYDELRRWCRDNFLSGPTLERLDALREQFRQQLAEVGFTSAAVPNNRASGRDAAFGDGNRRGGPSVQKGAAWEDDAATRANDPDKNSGNIALVQSVLCAGLYPHVAAFVRPDPQRQVRKAHFVTRDDAEPVLLHPSSVNHRRFSAAAATGRQVWVIFHSKIKTKQVYMHDSTYATPFSLLLWGARVRHERQKRSSKKGMVEVVIDRWLRFRMEENTAVAFKAMRRELSNLLLRKIEAPFSDTSVLASMLVGCLERLLEIESSS